MSGDEVMKFKEESAADHLSVHVFLQFFLEQLHVWLQGAVEPGVPLCSVSRLIGSTATKFPAFARSYWIKVE